MLSYLTRELHLPLTKAANTLTNFNGTAALTPLLGAFIADAYAGRFWTITVASLVYQMVDITPPIPLIFILFSSGIIIIACRQKKKKKEGFLHSTLYFCTIMSKPHATPKITIRNGQNHSIIIIIILQLATALI